jgi:hypothetical protein
VGGVLTAPLLVASVVLCVAGIAKLRSPEAASRALAGGRLPSGRGLVRGFAAGELILGAWSLISPNRLTAAAVCVVFVLFTVLSALLARRASSCGCFGTDDTPATALQSLLSAGFALAAAAACAWPPHGLNWIAGRSPGLGAALLAGVAAAAYATVLAYTELPAAWGAWERP